MKKSISVLKNIVAKSVRNATIGILSSINDCDH